MSQFRYCCLGRSHCDTIWMVRRGLGPLYFFFFQAEDGIRDVAVTGVQTCALPIFSQKDIGWPKTRISNPLAALKCAAAESPYGPAPTTAASQVIIDPSYPKWTYTRADF